jgi:hypothetical protein
MISKFDLIIVSAALICALLLLFILPGNSQFEQEAKAFCKRLGTHPSFTSESRKVVICE